MTPLRYQRFLRIPFEWWLRWYFRKHLSRIVFDDFRPQINDNRLIVFFANHTSWWDGFLLWEFQRRWFPKSAIYTLMQQEKLQSNQILRVLGALPFRPRNGNCVRTTLEHLARELEIRSEPVILTVFAQGKIWPSTKRPLAFQIGVENWLTRFPFSIGIPIGIHFEPLYSPKPTAFVSVGPALASGTPDFEIEAAVTTQLEKIQQQLENTGELLGKRWEKASFICSWE